jgi:sulfatase maturation enzyme AslB (radical SAM superfamily)
MTKSCVLKGKQKVFLLHLEKAASCCRAYPTALSGMESMNSLLQQWQQESLLLDQGVELENCRVCWDQENQGLQSYRQQRSPTWVDSNLVELFIDNTCNQMCSYCSPKFSSTWQKSISEQGVFQKISLSAQNNLVAADNAPNPDLWLNRIHDYINQCEDNSVTLAIVGGEPLMQIRNLQELLSASPKKIRKLRITTNLNPPSPKFLHWVLDNFPLEKLFFLISLDTIPEYNAIPRAGFDQQRFEDNLSLLNLRKVEFKFLSVISVLNIFSLNKYQQWISRHGYALEFFRLNNPDCLDASYLPQQFKQALLNQGLPDLAQQALHQQRDMVDIKQFEQYNYLQQYFQRTNTRLTDPELASYWSWLKEKFK